MELYRLAVRNIEGSAFRSWIVFLCAALMAGFAVGATIVIGGAQKSMQLAIDRLGADVIVMPTGSEEGMENAFLMGAPVRMWMPDDVVGQVAGVSGVEAVSPQLYLSTLRGATCCSLPEMFLVAYEPETDFTLRPWLDTHLANGLQLGETVGGAYVYLPSGQDTILIYGSEVTLNGNLDPTGTGLDQTMFMTFETAREIARLSPKQAEQPLLIPEESVSAVMVKVAIDRDPASVAAEIRKMLPDVSAVESSNLFSTHRVQLAGLLKTVVALLAITWLMAIALTGLVFSMAVNERRREIGVLRALGATQPNVLQSILFEGVLLALGGGMAGIGLAMFSIYLFQNLIMDLMGVPFLYPSAAAMIGLTAGGLALALVSVVLAAMVPALRISQMDPAVAMRK